MSRVADRLPEMVAALESLGVEYVFGLPGTQNVPLFEALRRSRVRTVLCTHELAASFAAVGYARAAGVPGVLATIPGPGFTYALSGLAEARLDSVPLVHLLGLLSPTPHGRFDHQAIPHRDIGAAAVKAWLAVGEGDALAGTVHDAFRLATSGEPGPVVVQLGPDGGPTDRAQVTDPPVGREAVTLATQRLAAASRPVLLLGQGAAPAAAAVARLAERLNAPVLTTPSGRGVVPESHRLCLGFDPDRGGVAVVNELLDGADVLFAVGCRMGYNGTAGFGLRLPEDRLVHVNADVDALGGPRPAGVPVRGRAQEVLPLVLDGLVGDIASTWADAEVASWRERIGAARASVPEPVLRGTTTGSAADFFAALQRALPADAVLVTDSGLHQALTRRHARVEVPGGLLVPADFQSMGFGVPAGVGASLANPGRRVAAVVGDGGFAIAGMELRTAVRVGVPLLVVVLNDGYLNLIRLQQLRDHGAPHGVELGHLDYEAYAGALGVGFVRVEDDVEAAVAWALSLERPVLVEVPVGDSSEILATWARGAVRSAGRRLLGPSVLARVKRLLRRDRGMPGG